MNGLQLTYEAARRGLYADPDPEECGCRGCGWYLSDVDTWHECPCHYLGQPHPEDEFGVGKPQWEAFSTAVVGYEVVDEDEDGKCLVKEFHVVITQKATGRRFVHQASFSKEGRAYGLAKRVAQSGKGFSQLGWGQGIWKREDLWKEDEVEVTTFTKDGEAVIETRTAKQAQAWA